MAAERISPEKDSTNHASNFSCCRKRGALNPLKNQQVPEWLDWIINTGLPQLLLRQQIVYAGAGGRAGRVVYIDGWRGQDGFAGSRHEYC